ncbi:hypothetical protein Tco_1518947, partial [Tanacetum coccineum]
IAMSAALIHDPLYKFCQSSLAMIMRQDNFDGVYYDNMFPYATEEVNNISLDLVLCMEPNNNFRPSPRAVEDFVTFLLPLKAKVEDHVHLNPSTRTFEDPTNKINFLHKVFHDLLIKLLMCLDIMEGMVLENIEYGRWKEFFELLKEFHDASKLYEGCGL